MVKTIFFDINGILREFKKEGISMSTRQAPDKVRQVGIRPFIVTGRHYPEVKGEKLLDDLVFDIYVTFNDQYCYEESPGRPVLYKSPIARDQVETILEIMEKEPFPRLFVGAHRRHLDCVDGRVEWVQQSIGARIPPLGGIKRVLFHDIYQAILYLDELGILEPVKKLPGCEYSTWHNGEGVGLTPKGGGKCTGIRQILVYYGTDIEGAAVTGDGNNDVSMLPYAGVDAAIGNGTAKARVAADYVIGDVVRDGLMQAADYLLSRIS